jgi:branched-chain amino acid transport system substrate-binding protein
VLRGWKHNSPRGPITIDPATRDIVMNEYMTEIVMKDGQLAHKQITRVEAVKDPCKEHKIGPCAKW